MSFNKPNSFEELVERYGEPWIDKQAFEQKHMTLWKKEICEDLAHIQLEMPFKRIYCNRDLVPFLDRAFVLLHDRELLQELKTFDGCWNVREIRGRPGKWSVHCFGMACDFNAAENPLGGPVAFSKKFLAAMSDAGFTLGADFKRIDAQHVQAANNC